LGLRWVTVAALFLGVALMPACRSSGDDDSTGGDGVRIDDQDAGSTVRLAKGESLVVELDGNPTTGFNWFVKTIDESVLKQVGDAEFAPDTEAPGSSGTVTLRFTAVSPGSTTLELDYYRPFEQNVPPAQTYAVEVEVH